MIFDTFASGQTWQIIAAILVVYLVYKIVIYFRLRDFKGPPGTGFTNLPHIAALLGPNSHIWYEQVSETYGKFSCILAVAPCSRPNVASRPHCESRTQSPHHHIARSLGTGEYSAVVQTIRLVL